MLGSAWRSLFPRAGLKFDPSRALSYQRFLVGRNRLQKQVGTLILTSQLEDLVTLLLAQNCGWGFPLFKGRS